MKPHSLIEIPCGFPLADRGKKIYNFEKNLSSLCLKFFSRQGKGFWGKKRGHFLFQLMVKKKKVIIAFVKEKGRKTEKFSALQWCQLQHWGTQCCSKHQEMVIQFWDTILEDIFKLLHPQMWYRIFPFMLSEDKKAHVV